MGGANPPTSLSQAVFPPPRGGAMGARPKRATLRGCFPWSNPPQMAPLNLGLLGFARSIPSRSLPIFTDFSDFLGITSSHSRVLFTSTTCLHGYMLFFQMMSSRGISKFPSETDWNEP